MDTGQIERIELDYTEEQEQVAKEKLKFTYNGIRFGGCCKHCSKPILESDSVYSINAFPNGVVTAYCHHKRCL